jgi:hypothetical protein
MNRIPIILPPARADRVHPLLILSLWTSSTVLAFAIIALFLA